MKTWFTRLKKNNNNEISTATLCKEGVRDFQYTAANSFEKNV